MTKITERLKAAIANDVRDIEAERLANAAPSLLEALMAAEQHLDYCGYGDKWERECADESGLESQIEAAIAETKGES